MKKLNAISRADLMRHLARQGSVTPEEAAVYGFQATGRTKERRTSDGKAAEGNGSTQTSKPEPAPVVLPSLPEKRLRLQVILPVETRIEPATEPLKPKHARLTDREIAVDWGAPAPPLRPLTPWKRLGPFLRRRLSRWTMGRRVDYRALFRLVARGLPVTQLPCRRYRGWSPEICLIWDVSPAMNPFQGDVRALRRHLRQEQGKQGVRCLETHSVPRLRALDRFSTEVPILALSTMGLYALAEDSWIRERWIQLGKKLRQRGHRIHALAPVPQRLWDPALAQTWSLSSWDRRPRLPREGGQRAQPSSWWQPDVRVESILTWLSPAARVEAGLLREVRLLMGAAADVGVEWACWFHAANWQGLEAFGFESERGREDRLKWRETLAAAHPEKAAAVAQLIDRYHVHCSSLIAEETALRACFSGDPNPARVKQVVACFERVVERMRAASSSGRRADAESISLASWFREMVDRLTEDIRKNEAVREVISRGLSLADSLKRLPRSVVPPGVNHQIYLEENRAVGKQSQGARDYSVVLSEDGLKLSLLGERAHRGTGTLASLQGGVRPAICHHANRSLERCDPAEFWEGQMLILRQPEQFELETESQHLRFQPLQRPDWAERLVYDRFGVSLRFRIDGVAFVLRWIPPGCFLMGSPADESGRDDDEGPQHEVTIARGFWLGETPVTQAQWKVIMGKNPSQFSGEDRPVEQVSWNDCSEFWSRLSDRLPDLIWRFPTESEWEYACRAGSTAAFNDGSPCDSPTGEDGGLHALAWYRKNSGNETHPVKGKKPNAWGLFDMHGNVDEWCADKWLRHYDNKPRIDSVYEGEGDARRVVRGGAWGLNARYCRSAYRNRDEPDIRWLSQGFRLAAGQPPEAVSAERSQERTES